MSSSTLSTRQKALAINLAAKWYGTIAEIGGGQEVGRWFFRAGAAAGTVAKTISAYDMAISNGVYGSAKRYVSRERLIAMLELEFDQVTGQLRETHGSQKSFFAFPDTVATRRFQSSEHGRGWIGIRFQAGPNAQPSQITLHAHLHDSLADLEQEALGVLGVNLIYGAFYLNKKPDELIAGLMDDPSRVRAEIDMIKFSGPAFEGIDNRLMSLRLVERGFTDAAMFTADGEVVQPSEASHRGAGSQIAERHLGNDHWLLALDVMLLDEHFTRLCQQIERHVTCRDTRTSESDSLSVCRPLRSSSKSSYTRGCRGVPAEVTQIIKAKGLFRRNSRPCFEAVAAPTT